MKNTLIFDTETTGLPPKGAKYDTNFNEFPYIVQLSWLWEGVMRDFIIKPEGYIIPEESTKIHGITHEMAMEKGVNIRDVFIFFIHDCNEVEKIVGHNIYFDTSIIKANVMRYAPESFETANEALDKSKRICTMMKTIKFVGAKFKNSNRYQFPKLTELYDKLFGETFNAHNSKDDVLATQRCYIELIRLGVIEGDDKEYMKGILKSIAPVLHIPGKMVDDYFNPKT